MVRKAVKSAVKRKKPERVTCRCVIDEDLAHRLEATRAQTGLSMAEQIRQGIRLWLESREWPISVRKRASDL